MHKAKDNKKASNRILLLSIFDTWELFNKEIPQKIENDKLQEEIKEERIRKLAPVIPNKENVFSSTEISIIKELISNPQASFVEIASKLNLSRHTVKKRIEEMLKQNKTKFFLGLNYQKLNLDLMILTIHATNIVSLNDLFQDLQNCPRVFSIVKDISKNSIQVLLGTEKSSSSISNPCVNIIEKLQSDVRIKECNIHALYPEMFPTFIPFTGQNFPAQEPLSPCKANCEICEKYLELKCDGCPASKAYRGNVFKKS